MDVETTHSNIRITAVPTSSFAQSTDSGCAPVKVNFTNKSNGEIYSYYYNFGNSDTSTSKNPVGSHTYLQSNIKDSIYYIKLYTSNLCGVSLFKDSIKAKSLPYSKFTFSPDSGCSPLTVSFANLSYGASTKFFWSFGNGITSNGINPSPQILTSTSDTTYLIKLIISNSCKTDSNSKTIKVNAHAKAKFTVNKTAGCIPLAVSNTDSSAYNSKTFTPIL